MGGRGLQDSHILLYAGQGSIGSKTDAVDVNLAGTLSANSGDSIYIAQTAGENLDLTKRDFRYINMFLRLRIL